MDFRISAFRTMVMIMLLAFVLPLRAQVDSMRAKDTSKREAEFSLLYQQLVDIRNNYDGNAMNVAAFILLAIGWLMTSDTGRDYLVANRKFNTFSLFVVCLIAVVHSAECFEFQNRSLAKIVQLNGVNHVDRAYYTDYLINLRSIATVLLTNLSLMSVLFMMLFSLRKRKVDKKID